jgi:hypothetical protein
MCSGGGEEAAARNIHFLHFLQTAAQSRDYRRDGGALGEIRTPDPQIRSLMLYPAELRAQIQKARAQ